MFPLLDWKTSSGSSTRRNTYVAEGGALTYGSRLSKHIWFENVGTN